MASIQFMILIYRPWYVAVMESYMSVKSLIGSVRIPKFHTQKFKKLSYNLDSEDICICILKIMCP